MRNILLQKSFLIASFLILFFCIFLSQFIINFFNINNEKSSDIYINYLTNIDENPALLNYNESRKYLYG